MHRNCTYGLNGRFNLADDFIEPFRVIVDKKVFELFEIERYTPIDFTPEIKKELINIYNEFVFVNGQKFTLFTALDKYVSRLHKAYEKQDTASMIWVEPYL